MKEWQLCNIQSFGIDLPMNKDFWIPATELQDIFAKILAKEINPQAIQPEGSLGHQWYEWLTRTAIGMKPETRGMLIAARHFSWNYPQLKMVIHATKVLKIMEEREHFLDSVDFMVEFYN